MPRYKSLTVPEAEHAIRAIAGLEPIIHDDQLVAVEVGGLRIWSDKGLKVSEREDTHNG